MIKYATIRHALPGAALATALTIGAAISLARADGRDLAPLKPSPILTRASDTVAPSDAGAAAVTPALLRGIVHWLSQNFDLPALEQLPNIAFTTPAQMTALRYRGLLDQQQGADDTDTVAIYEAPSRTIYLPIGWSGATPAEMSILVHEVVHHLQHTAGLPYACPAEREKLAYQAQERWLQQFGRSLASEFGTDGFTLLVRTNCGF